jgi:hypothetical protein
VDTLLVRPQFRHLKVLDLRYEWINDSVARLLLSADGLVQLPRLLLPAEHDMSQDMVANLQEYFGQVELVPESSRDDWYPYP